MLFRFDAVADGGDGGDKGIKIEAFCQEFANIVGIVVIIGVKRDIIDVIVAVVEHFLFPLAEGWHHQPGASASDQFD